MGKFLVKYNRIVAQYKNGEFGDGHLSLREILSKAGEPDLMKEMNLSEIQYLIDSSSGISKYMFTLFKEQKISEVKKMDRLESELQKLQISKYCDGSDISEERLARNLKLDVIYCNPEDLPEDDEALLLPTDDPHYFGVIKISNECVTKFPYMHEIIHYLRDVGVGKRVLQPCARKKSGKTDTAEEQDVNYLTAAAVMPYDSIFQELGQYEKEDLDEESFIMGMTEKYGQGVRAVSRRFIEVRSIADYRVHFS